MREVTCSVDAKTGIATLGLDTAGPINTIGTRLVSDLQLAWDEASSARAVVLRSAKRRSFLDGANLVELMRHASARDLQALLERFHEVMAAMAEAPIPVLAAVEGATALGGGCELLLWATDHVVATPGSRIGLPEVNVGLFPAGGGTHTLRRWVGLETALDVMSRGRVLPAEHLVDAGLVSTVAADAVDQALLSWIESHPEPENRSLVEPEEASNTTALIGQYRRRFQVSSSKPWFKALYDSVEAGLGRPVVDAAADDIVRFVDLWQQPTSRNAIDFFFLSQSLGPRLARVDDRAGVPVDRLAVIGAGLMGRGIAQVAADSGIEVSLLDVSQEQLDTAVEDLRQTLDGLVARGRWSEQRRNAVLDRIDTTLDLERLEGVPLVIEAVFEDLELKQHLLARVQAVAPGTVFASNTSTIPMAQIASGSARPEQVVGMHFFSPVPLMALLEVVRGPQSSESAVATAVAVGRRLGKSCILVSDGPGFYTSRCFGIFVLTGLVLAELGMHPQEVDRIAVDAGFPQGPLHVYGSVGGAVVYHAGRFMADNVPYHEVPPSLERLFAAGYVGAGRPCFYLDPRGHEFDASVMEHITSRSGPTPSPGEVRDMLLLGMVNEAFHCLEDGVLPDLASMDLGAVLGVGFPQCWHGPARYTSLRGVKTCRDRLTELHERFNIAQLAPSAEFNRLLACGVDGGLI